MTRKDTRLRNDVFLGMSEGRHPHPRKGSHGPYTVAEIAAIVGLSEQAVRDGIRSARSLREIQEDASNPGRARTYRFA